MSRRYAAAALLALTVFLILLLDQRVQLDSTQQRLQQLKAERARATVARTALRLEVESLTRFTRIEPMALALGLVKPRHRIALDVAPTPQQTVASLALQGRQVGTERPAPASYVP